MRTLAGDGYASAEVCLTPNRTEIIILATRGIERGQRIHEDTSVVQKRIGFPENSVNHSAEKGCEVMIMARARPEGGTQVTMDFTQLAVRQPDSVDDRQCAAADGFVEQRQICSMDSSASPSSNVAVKGSETKAKPTVDDSGHSWTTSASSHVMKGTRQIEEIRQNKKNSEVAVYSASLTEPAVRSKHATSC